MHSNKYQHASYWFSNSWNNLWNVRNLRKQTQFCSVKPIAPRGLSVKVMILYLFVPSTSFPLPVYTINTNKTCLHRLSNLKRFFICFMFHSVIFVFYVHKPSGNFFSGVYSETIKKERGTLAATLAVDLQSSLEWYRSVCQLWWEVHRVWFNTTGSVCS